MEIKRLYNKETNFLFLRGAIVLGTAIMVILSILFLPGDSTSSFEKNLLSNNYQELYRTVDSPNFSVEIFELYMKYNFGEDIEILEKTKDGRNYNYRIKGKQSEKLINLVRKDGEYRWIFNDYVNNWTIKVPLNARVFIQNQEIQNEKGAAFIERIPFGVYSVRVEMDKCKPYTENIMVGQNLQVKMEPSEEFVEKCRGYLEEYFRFKESLINEDKLLEIAWLDKGSGIYREVIEEAEILKGDSLRVSKKLLGFKVDRAIFNDEMNIVLDITENWSVEITNQGELSELKENHKRNYVFTLHEPVKLIQIKTIK